MEFDRRTSKVETSGFDLAQNLRTWQRVYRSAFFEDGGGDEEAEAHLSDHIPLKGEHAITSIEADGHPRPNPSPL
jgi:hypothetical protein